MASRTDPRSRYLWDPAVAQYRSRLSGRFVDRKTIRAALDAALATEERIMAEGIKALGAGKMTLDSWYAVMRQSIKLVHLWSAAAAKGGWAQLTAAEYGFVGSTVRFHYDRLAKFVDQLALGLPITRREEFRVGMYAQAGRATYHAIELPTAIIAGYDEERNILDEKAEHCDECLELSSREWVPIGTLPRLGERSCLTNDRCSLEYRRSGGQP